MKFWPKKRKKESKIFYDIIPPEILKRAIFLRKKTSLWLHAFRLFLKTSKYGSLAILALVIFGGMAAWAIVPKEENKTIQIYPTNVEFGAEAAWENAGKVLGAPEVAEDGNLDNFSEDNSAVYKSGPSSLIISGFQKNKDAAELNENSKEEFKSVKIKFSFALGEKKADLEIQELQKNLPVETEEDIKESSEAEDGSLIMPIFSPEPISEIAMPADIQSSAPFPEETVFQEILPEETPSQEENEPVSIKNLIKNSFNSSFGIFLANAQEETSSAEAQAENSFSLPLEQSLLDKNEAISGETLQVGPDNSSDGVLFESNADSLPNIDDKIIVSYSFDGEVWWDINTISGNSLSNALNGGYFSYNALLVKNWEDIKNLRIKFEGVVGGETRTVSYLDSVWVEAEYIGSEEAENGNDAKNKDINNEVEIKSLSSKKDFKREEEPELKFHYEKKQGIIAAVGEVLGLGSDVKIKTTAKIIDPNGKSEDALPEEIIENNGDISIKLKKDRSFKPGLYKVILAVQEIDANGDAKSNETMIEQEFTWGVLTVNVNKSIYLLGEKAYVQMGVLNNDGKTVCNAKLVLTVKYQVSGVETFFSTEDGTIERSGKCKGDNVTDVPDYFAHYQVSEAGIYQMTLTRIDPATNEKISEIADSFEVRDSVPFEVERIGPTRIWPMAPYEMIFKIKANQDFTGEIIETVPEGFVVKNQELRIKNQKSGESIIQDSKFMIQEQNDKTQSLIFQNVNLKIGDELEIRYTFDAPDISPYIYLLGPLEFRIQNIENRENQNDPKSNILNSIFSEARQWQIASDAVPTFQAAGTMADGTGSVTPAWPTHVANDVALLFVEAAGGEAISLTTANGFVQVTNSPQATGTTINGTRLAVYWARATSSSMSAPVVADSGDHTAAVILTFRGVITTGDPWDVTGGGVKASASTSVTATGVTTTVMDTLVVVGVTSDLDQNQPFASNWANSNLSGVAERYDVSSNKGTGGGIAVMTGTKTNDGATGDTTATVDSSVNAFLTIALKPPVVSHTIDQKNYRFYENINALKPTTALASENTRIGGIASATALRIRMNILVQLSSIQENDHAFKLQYASAGQGTSAIACSAISSGTWADVGAAGGATIWRGYTNAGVTDGTALSGDPPTGGDLLITNSNRTGTYESTNNSALNPYAIADGDYAEYDWVIQNNGAAASTYYCFRMIESTGTVLDTYTNYPRLATLNVASSHEQHQWATVDNSEVVISGEDTTRSGVWTGDTVRMRIMWKDNGNPISAGKPRIKYYTSYTDFAADTNGKFAPNAGVGIPEIAPFDKWEFINSCSGTWCDHGNSVTTVRTSDHSPLAGRSLEQNIAQGDSYMFDWTNTGGNTGPENNFSLKYIGADVGANYFFRVELDGALMTFSSMHYGTNKAVMVTTAAAGSVSATPVITMPVNDQDIATAVKVSGTGVVGASINIEVHDHSTGSPTLGSGSTTVAGDGTWTVNVTYTEPAAGTVLYVHAWQTEGGKLPSTDAQAMVYQRAAYTIEQSTYRWFNNADSTDVGSVLAAQDTATTAPAQGTKFRLRLATHIGTANVSALRLALKLQFAQMSVACDTAYSGESWNDVTASTSIAYANNTPADGAALTDNTNDPVHPTSHVNTNQTYEELNNFTNTSAITAGDDGLWDFALVDSSAPATTSYCFRIVRSDDTLIGTPIVVPQITTATPTGITVSGNAYADEGTTVWANCDHITPKNNVSLVVNGTLVGSTSCNSSTGAYSFSTVTVALNNPVSVFFNTASGNTDKGAAVTVAADATTAITLNPRKNIVWLKTEGAVANITNGNLDHCDSGSPVDCANVPYSVTSPNLVVADGSELHIETAKTFAPGGTVTTSPSGVSGDRDGDIHIMGTFSAGTNSVSVGGDWNNAGTFSKTNPETVTFTATGSGFSIDPGTSNFNNIVFNGSGGGWTAVTNTFTADGTLTVTAGNFNTGTVTNSVTGATSVTGTLTHSTGTKTYTGDVSMNSGGVWNETGAAVVNFGGSLTNNATTWTASTGTHTFSGTSKTISGSTATVIPTVSVSGTVTNSGTMTVSTALSGAGTFTNGNGTTGTLNFGGSTLDVTTFDASASNNTVNYSSSSGGQTIRGVTYNNLTLSNSSNTNTAGGAVTSSGTFTTTAGGTLDMATYALSVSTVSHSGTLKTQNTTATPVTTGKTWGGTVDYNAAGGQTVVLGTYNNLTLSGSGTKTLPGSAMTISNDFTFGGTASATAAAALAIGGNVLLGSGTDFNAASYTHNIGGNWTNNGATFTASTSTINFNAGATGKTIVSGGTGAGKDFYDIVFNNSAGGWTIQTNNLTVARNFTITDTAASGFTLESGRTLEVKGTYSVADAETSNTTWTGSTLYLNSGTFYTVGAKTQSAETYATLQIGANTDIRLWNSSASAYTVDSTGSLYSQDHANIDGDLYIWGDYNVPDGGATDYWSYVKDFNGDAVTRQVDVTLQSGASVTVGAGESLEIKGGGLSDGSDFTAVTYAPASGSWNLNNSTGAEIIFQEATINYMKVNAGTVTALNTILNNEVAPAAGAVLNVDWYLGAHSVDEITPANPIDTAADAVIISENSGTPASTVYKWNGSSWVAGTSQATETDGSGLMIQPGTSGAIRVREYARGSAGFTYYLYNMYIDWTGNYGAYDYKDDQGGFYLTSTLDSGSSHDKIISETWLRNNIDVNNAEVARNAPPTNGTWYVGMLAGLSFSIDSFSVNLGTIDPGVAPTDGTNTLTVTTSGTNGYVITAWTSAAMTCSDAGACAAETITDWTGINATPTTWTNGSSYFGYTTNDSTLTGGGADRFSNGGTKYAGFVHTGAGDPVADRTSSECPCTSQANIITYRIESSMVQRPGPYQTTVIYIATATY